MKVYESTTKETPIHKLVPSYWSEQPIKYANQLRTVWLDMIEKYPQYYKLEDYGEAIKTISNLPF